MKNKNKGKLKKMMKLFYLTKNQNQGKLKEMMKLF